MDRRKFLIGLGGASLGGSALIGTGAFSQIQSQRGVQIQIAHDSDAYLGLDGCPDSPNQSYTGFEDGHLYVDMTPDNPTNAGGQGVNSDSRTWFDNVFQICNQGKDTICVYIEDDADWPWYTEDERHVQFYPEDDRDGSLIGISNKVELETTDCICVGIRTTTKTLTEDELLLDDIGNEIRLVADVECGPENGECVSCPDDDFEGGRLGEITFLNDAGERHIVVSDDGAGSGDSLFDEVVGAGETFTVEGLGPPGTPDIEIYIDDMNERISIEQDGSEGETYHTSCSAPVYAGQRLHSDSSEPAYGLVVQEAKHHNSDFTIC